MSDMNRRQMCTALAAFAVMAAQSVEAQGDAGADDTSRSRVYRFSEMKVTPNSNGGWSRAILHGTLPTGEYVAAHQTMLPPGQMPHPPHQHRDSEFVMIREGQLEFYNEGKPEPVGPGDVIYTASMRMHGMKNVGTTNALYFVVEISSPKV
jgi:quercetin dioxygenase-like cupin family protein